jgi:hypothetical protein
MHTHKETNKIRGPSGATAESAAVDGSLLRRFVFFIAMAPSWIEHDHRRKKKREQLKRISVRKEAASDLGCP